MNPENDMIIRISPSWCRITLESMDKGVTAFKQITQADFLDCIKNCIRNQGISSGILPEGCFHFSTDNTGNKWYCLRYPELYSDIYYYTTEYPSFPLPRLVFGFEVNPDGKVLGRRIGIIADEKPGLNTLMYIYPFSNVGGFNLCVGNNVLPVYKNPAALATLPGYLLRLPNNDDSFNSNNNRLGMGYRELLNHLKDKEPSYYYTNVLKPNGKTLKDFIYWR